VSVHKAHVGGGTAAHALLALRLHEESHEESKASAR
jgi:hypothetical protein